MTSCGTSPRCLATCLRSIGHHGLSAQLDAAIPPHALSCAAVHPRILSALSTAVCDGGTES
eukprot:2143308-Prorocentrum_lima.AAC.1